MPDIHETLPPVEPVCPSMTDPISVKTSVKCVVPLWLLRFSFIQLSSLRPQTCSVNVRTCKASAVKLNSSTWSKYIIDDTAESRGCRRWTIRGKLSSCSRKQRRIVNPNLNPISSSPGTDIDPEVDFIWIAVRLRGVVLSVPNSSRGSHSCFLAGFCSELRYCLHPTEVYVPVSERMSDADLWNACGEGACPRWQIRSFFSSWRMAFCSKQSICCQTMGVKWNVL